MSRRSVKQGRPTVERGGDEVHAALNDRRLLMLEACNRWDESRRDREVVTIASMLRVMLGQDDRLIDRVTRVKRLLFCNSELQLPLDQEAQETAEATSIGVGGLAVMKLAEAGPPTIVPSREVWGDEQALEMSRWVPFRDWWATSQPVRKDSVVCSREFLVYEAANTDAAHVSNVLDYTYVELRSAIRGVTWRGADGTEGDVSGAVPAALRQIAWEVETTLTRALGAPRE